MVASPCHALLVLALAVPSAVAVPREVAVPPRPAKGERIVDEAGLIAVHERAAIRETCELLERDLRIPLRIVTLRSLEDYGAGGWELSRYAVELFDEWSLEARGLEHGFAEWDRGILVLVSVADTRVHVELGDAWLAHHRELSRRVVRELVLPELEAGRPSRALFLATQGLDAMARELELPPPRGSWLAALWKSLAVAFVVTTLVAGLQRRSLRGALALWRSWLWAPFDRLERRVLDDEFEEGGPLAESTGAEGRW